MSFVEDFEAIASALKAIEQEKPKSPIVTDPNPPDYVELPTVESVYGVCYPIGYVEAFKAYKQALNSTPFQLPDVRLNSSPGQYNDFVRKNLAAQDLASRSCRSPPVSLVDI